jgi:hypothetical protein
MFFKVFRNGICRQSKKNGGHSVMFLNDVRNGICRQCNQIVQHSVIGKAYPEGGVVSSLHHPGSS